MDALLTINMLTMEAVRLLAACAGRHEILYLETAGAGTKIAVNSPRGTLQRQKYVDSIVQSADLSSSLDDFSEKFLHPAMKELWRVLSEDKIAYTHTLVVPNQFQAARHVYDGFCMRGLMEPKLAPGMLPTYRGESEDYKLRFDALYSRARD